MLRTVLLACLLFLSYSSYQLQASEPVTNEVPPVKSSTLLSMAYHMMDGHQLPSFKAFSKAATGYFNLLQEGQLSEESRYLAIADFSLPSSQKRLWIVDVQSLQVVLHTYVAHGRNSGDDKANRFSNIPESYQSSLGFYRTEAEYYGKHGRSLRLQGLDKGFNDKAMTRAIVLHGADYVSEAFIRQQGRLGRSFGCPAVPMAETNTIIDILGSGSLLFIYYPDTRYLTSSKWLQQPEVASLENWLEAC